MRCQHDGSQQLNYVTIKQIFSSVQPMIFRLSTFVLCLIPVIVAYADKADLGLPACEQIIGVDRNIEIGNTVSYTIEYLEKNNYRCGEFQGRVNEMISCSFRLDRKYEIILTVEEGQVTDIDTLSEGNECSYFNLLPKDPCREDPFASGDTAQIPGCPK